MKVRKIVVAASALIYAALLAFASSCGSPQKPKKNISIPQPPEPVEDSTLREGVFELVGQQFVQLPEGCRVDWREAPYVPDGYQIQECWSFGATRTDIYVSAIVSVADSEVISATVVEDYVDVSAAEETAVQLVGEIASICGSPVAINESSGVEVLFDCDSFHLAVYFATGETSDGIYVGRVSVTGISDLQKQMDLNNARAVMHLAEQEQDSI